MIILYFDQLGELTEVKLCYLIFFYVFVFVLDVITTVVKQFAVVSIAVTMEEAFYG